ncbi:DUF4328 domain-containing protein [Demequina phytophila]|uniref:DUF4328 domain-containing protein n=1 Tax=Demequina phytophila TaxID=1638981 RepID=UPI00078074B8|nr:DUF4328 domain-containing protein [Demequina phytophila]
MTDNDPFVTRPGDPTPPPPPASSPGTPPAGGAPGLIPGALPPSVPAYGEAQQVQFDRSGVPLEKPEGLAKGLIGVTAAYAVLAVITAAFAQGEVESLRRTAETGEFSITAASALGLLSLPLTVTAYVLYGMWMTRMRRNREALGARPGMGAVEWWGWFVPLASVVLVPLGARKVTGRTVPLMLLLGWWIAWTIAQILSAYGSIALNFSFDLMTGELTNPDMLDSYPTWAWASAAVLLISWGFLFRFIRTATDRHVDADA